MSEHTLEKLKTAFDALHKFRKFPSIRKIADTAARFIKRAINKTVSEQPRITMPPKILPCIQIDDPFIKHERDAFRMKAFSLLNSKTYSYSVSQKLDWLQNAPIERIVNPESKEISFFQVLKPFPGERIELKGTFKRHQQRAEHTAPVAGSFQVDLKSEITGFPHPSQHTGWALTAADLDSPHQHALLKQAQLMLAPGNEFRENAQLWTEAKRAAFNQNAALFLEMHQNLIEILYTSSDQKIADFYSWIKDQEDPFSFLSSVHSFDFFEEPAVVDYQELLNQCLGPSARLALCAELQLESFLKSLQQKPPSTDLIVELLKQLISSDISSLKLTESLYKN